MIIEKFGCIGNISGIPEYRLWTQEQSGPTNVDTVLMLPEVRDARIKIRSKTAQQVAQRHGYTDTDVLGADPLDYTRWRIVDHSVIDRIAAALGLTSAVGRVQVQSPGQMVLPHCDDLAKSYMGDLAEVEHYCSVNLTAQDRQRFEQDPRSATRVLIMLEDWRMGQGFSTEQGAITGWRQGDVFAWDWPTGIHATFNNGYWPRPLLKMTGMTTERWNQWFVNEAAFNLEI